MYSDGLNKMAVLQFGYQFLIFDSTSGTLVAMALNILPPTGSLVGCVAGLCISYLYSETDSIQNFIAVDYLTGSLTWNVTVPAPIGGVLSMMYLRPTLLIFTCMRHGGVVGIDPTSGKFWAHISVGGSYSYLLQQVGNSQVLVTSYEVLVLANV